MNTEMIQREIELLARVLAAQMNSIAELEASLDREVTFNNKLTKKLEKRILELEAAPKVKTLTAQVAEQAADVVEFQSCITAIGNAATGYDWSGGLAEYVADAFKQLAALKAENEELRKDAEWRDIETAPKDNTVFLAWRKHATHPLMVRYEPSYDWFANYDGEHIYDITHWMPLPKPPAMAQGEK